jgi:hypothetical protein
MQHDSDTSSVEKSPETASKSNRRTKYKALAFLICLAISFVLWYLAASSQKPIVDFSLP